MKATEGVTQARATRTGIGAKAKLPLIAEGEAELHRDVSDTETDAAERTYDPLWTNARSLLAILEERSLIERNLPKARIGQFVLASGRLNVTDLSIAKSIIQLPVIKKQLASLMPKTAKGEINPMDFALSLVEILPHSVHASLGTEDHKIWSVLVEESLSLSPSNIFLSQGTSIQGTWNILGILDAIPSGDSGDEDEDRVSPANTETMEISKLVEILRQWRECC